jgi:hypothetical protein
VFLFILWQFLLYNGSPEFLRLDLVALAEIFAARPLPGSDIKHFDVEWHQVASHPPNDIMTADRVTNAKLKFFYYLCLSPRIEAIHLFNSSTYLETRPRCLRGVVLYSQHSEPPSSHDNFMFIREGHVRTEKPQQLQYQANREISPVDYHCKSATRLKPLKRRVLTNCQIHSGRLSRLVSLLLFLAHQQRLCQRAEKDQRSEKIRRPVERDARPERFECQDIRAEESQGRC